MSLDLGYRRMLEEEKARLREASGDHFYGPWKGGAKAEGGHGAGGAAGEKPVDKPSAASEPTGMDTHVADLGASDPRNLDASGKPWKDATGAHVEGWGPRGPLNDKGEEQLYAKSRKNAGLDTTYSVPRGYNDVANEGHGAKGFAHDGSGIAYTKPTKTGQQLYEARLPGKYENGAFQPTQVVHATSQTASPGSFAHRVTVDGKVIGTVSDQTGKWRVDLESERGERGGQGVMQMVRPTKALAVLEVISGWDGRGRP